MSTPWPRRGTSALASEPSGTFDAAARSVSRFLSERLPMGLWLVSRSDLDVQPVYVASDDDGGDEPVPPELVAWARSLGRAMVADGHSKAATDLSQEPSLVSATSDGKFRAGAFIGAPLLDDDRHVIGVLCGVDPDRHDVDLDEKLPLVQELAALLSWVLALEIESDQAKLQAVAAMEHGQRDGLTGVLNRRGWDLALEREAHRLKTLDQGASILIIDLDDLKGMNDCYGHAYGDDQIRALAQCISSAARANDLVARIGGDEFGLLAPGSKPGTADELAARLRAEFDRRRIRATVGGAECPPGGNLGDTWRRADMEMYAGKRLGQRPEPPSDRPTGPTIALGEVVANVVSLAQMPCRIARAVLRTVASGLWPVTPAADPHHRAPTSERAPVAGGSRPASRPSAPGRVPPPGR
jgi:diguanylate cyclase